MPVAEPKAVEFNVDVRDSEPREVLFFDRFAVYKKGNFFELHFGFFGGSPELIRGLIVVLQQDVFERNKESFLNFINLGGDVPEPTELPPFKVRSSDAPVLTADLIGLARHGAVGEIAFHSLSWKIAIDTAKDATEPPTVQGYFVALLRSELELQKRWVIAVYDANERNG
jgi:hypothetical protein